MHLSADSVIALAGIVITVASIFASHNRLAKKVETAASTVQKDAPVVAAAVNAAEQVAQDVAQATK